MTEQFRGYFFRRQLRMDRGTFDILLNVLRPAVTREHAEGGRRAGEEIGVVSGETILIVCIETDHL